MNPKLNTSLRGRGKWGDFLISFIPLSWCVNILLNSNFILRMIEWQNESSLFTIRIHGKQWYWVYKFELRDMADIWTAPKNIGRNRWAFLNPNELSVSDFYLQAIQVRNKSKWLREYWPEIIKKDIKPNSSVDLSSSTESSDDSINFKFNTEDFIALELENNFRYKPHTPVDYIRYKNPKIPTQFSTLLLTKINPSFFAELPVVEDDLGTQESSTWADNLFSAEVLPNNNTLFSLHTPTTTLHYESVPLDDQWDIEHNIRKLKAVGPLRLIKYTLTPEYLKSSTDLFKVRFFNDSEAAVKTEDNSENFWVLKQKRYKKKQAITQPQYTVTDFYDNKVYTKNDNVPKFNTSRVLLNAAIFENLDNFVIKSKKKDEDELDTTAFDLYTCVRNNKKRGELLPITLTRRLLRTKRTLVLPAHINMTIVTNSYDVVHSWFIPGLGIKLDCVPGRATHHSLYIDNIGFYYGQCAEICGRYHHHMPIRVCALPFEHFLVWWRVKGVPKLLKIKLTDPLKEKTRLKSTLYEHEVLNYSKLKYYW